MFAPQKYKKKYNMFAPQGYKKNHNMFAQGYEKKQGSEVEKCIFGAQNMCNEQQDQTVLREDQDLGTRRKQVLK